MSTQSSHQSYFRILSGPVLSKVGRVCTPFELSSHLSEVTKKIVLRNAFFFLISMLLTGLASLTLLGSLLTTSSSGTTIVPESYEMTLYAIVVLCTFVFGWCIAPKIGYFAEQNIVLEWYYALTLPLLVLLYSEPISLHTKFVLICCAGVMGLLLSIYPFKLDIPARKERLGQFINHLLPVSVACTVLLVALTSVAPSTIFSPLTQ